ncbi:SRPBCC family protein [Intrasporangium sp. YIM S08009]|uniref:SRPBCC family protein n=1 Tax=Intrasporangium zincisolvens TaxID=3080018 RepID=UPI002B05E930|nr:SRPBCC family protein [Intrasporangium sp. YIM S08009]
MRPFRFQHSWLVPAGTAATFAALADVDAYPQWWPQVRQVRRIDADSGHAYVRSLLPYTLDLVLTREVEDADGGVLRVRIGGDLEGWSEFRLEPATSDRRARAGAVTLARYSQEAVVTARGLDRLTPVAAPVLRLNHAWMMRAGERGLAAWLGRSAGPGESDGSGTVSR